MADAKRRAAAKKSAKPARGVQSSASGAARATNEDSPKRPARKSTKSTQKSAKSTQKSTKRTSTGKRAKPDNRASSRQTPVAPHLAPVQPSSAPRKVTMGSRSRTVSLRSDLNKYESEKYRPEEFVKGAQLIIDAGAGSTLRDLVASVLRSKGAFGNMQSEHAMEGLLDQLTDGYRKRKVAERKSIRAMLNWCSGLVETDQEVEGQLLTTVLSQGS